MDNNSSSSNESIDFGGRFCRQFNRWKTVGLADINNNNISTPNLNSSNSNYLLSSLQANNSASIDLNSISSSNYLNSSTNSNYLISSLQSTNSNHIDLNSTSSSNYLNSSTNSNHLNSSTSSSYDFINVSNNLNVMDDRINKAAYRRENTGLSQLSDGLSKLKMVEFPSNEVVRRQQRSSSLFSYSPNLMISPWSSAEVIGPSNESSRVRNNDVIEARALMHKKAAAFSEARYTWSGVLPTKVYENPAYSCKVFLGGVPWDVNEQSLLEKFGRFGSLRIQWPGKEAHSNSDCWPPSRQNHSQYHSKAGYVYLIYDSERYVKNLLAACTQDFGVGSGVERFYYQLSSSRMRFKEVQVIPWILADSNYISFPLTRPETGKTVFVGALHGMLTAEGLAKIMNDLFGGVVFVGIDSDKFKYPIGSGRVTFNNVKSYMKAVAAGFIEVKSAQFCKKIQVDPYLEPADCSVCQVQAGPVFCRNCFRYFCKNCWSWHHSTGGTSQHLPLIRKKRDTSHAI